MRDGGAPPKRPQDLNAERIKHILSMTCERQECSALIPRPVLVVLYWTSRACWEVLAGERSYWCALVGSAVLCSSGEGRPLPPRAQLWEGRSWRHVRCLLACCIKTTSLRNLCLLSVVLLPSDNLGPKFQHGCAKPEKANLKGVVGDRGWLRALARGS